MGLKKHNPGCMCCGGGGSTCANEDTTTWSAITVSGLPTGITAGPFSVPDFNGTYMLSAMDPTAGTGGTPCDDIGGEVPIPLFGTATDPTCCTYSMLDQFDDYVSRADQDCGFGPLTDVRFLFRALFEIAAFYVSSTEVSYRCEFNWRVGVSYIYGGSFFSTYNNTDVRRVRIPIPTVETNSGGSIINPVTATTTTTGPATKNHGTPCEYGSPNFQAVDSSFSNTTVTITWS